MLNIFVYCVQLARTPQHRDILGLIDQSNVEMSANPSTEIILRQSSHVIHETFVCCQAHHKNDHMLINVAAQNNRHLNITLLKIHDLEALPLEFTTWRK